MVEQAVGATFPVQPNDFIEQFVLFISRVNILHLPYPPPPHLINSLLEKGKKKRTYNVRMAELSKRTRRIKSEISSSLNRSLKRAAFQVYSAQLFVHVKVNESTKEYNPRSSFSPSSPLVSSIVSSVIFFCEGMLVTSDGVSKLGRVSFFSFSCGIPPPPPFFFVS